MDCRQFAIISINIQYLSSAEMEGGGAALSVKHGLRRGAELRLREIFGSERSHDRHLVIHKNAIAVLNCIGGASLLKKCGVQHLYQMQSSPPRLKDQGSKFVSPM